MTPAIAAVQQAGIDFTVREYEHRPGAESYGLEAAEALHVHPDRVLKTLVVSLEGGSERLALAIVPASRLLDLKAFARARSAKKAELARTEIAEKATGYVIGGISPLGQKRPLPAVLDQSALTQDSILVSAGKRGLQLELAPADLVRLTRAGTAAIARPDGPGHPQTHGGTAR